MQFHPWGSTAVWGSAPSRAVSSPVPAQLELGTKNGIRASSAADPKIAARVALAGAMGNGGQECAAADAAYVDADISREFWAQVERARSHEEVETFVSTARAGVTRSTRG
jgi:betaine-aldehyde dehydrogenase